MYGPVYTRTSSNMTEPNIVNGVMLPPFAKPERIKQIPEFEVRPDDVIVVSYPKSGTQWTSEIIWHVLNNGSNIEPPVSFRGIFFESGRDLLRAIEKPLEVQSSIDAEKSPRLLFTHLPFDMMSPCLSGASMACKVICVARNPKDVAVSWYHHQKSDPFVNYKGTWHEFFELFIAGKVLYGAWFDRVLAWWARRDDPNLLFIKYEDLSKNLVEGVRTIAKFLGKDLDKDLSPDVIQHIARQCSFKEMSQAPLADLFRNVPNRDQTNVSRFLRKGQVGDWKNYFTLEQNERFNKEYAKRMADSGLEFDFGE